MATSFSIGLVAGVYVGIMLREEYFFPTSEKVSQALAVFQRNREAIEEARKPADPVVPAQPEKKEQQ